MLVVWRGVALGTEAGGGGLRRRCHSVQLMAPRLLLGQAVASEARQGHKSATYAAAMGACEKAGQWQLAVQLFQQVPPSPDEGRVDAWAPLSLSSLDPPSNLDPDGHLN